MNKSEQINELATALAKAQGKMKGAIKDSSNPFFKSKYADLANVIDDIRLPFSENGLSYMQYTISTEKGLELETMIMHSSGQWISATHPIKPAKEDMQAVLAATTYARRGLLSAMAGVSQIDDDGNSTQQAKPTTQMQQAGQATINPFKTPAQNGYVK